MTTELIHEKISIDCSKQIGHVSPIWRSFGYDEINWTYTPRGKKIFQQISSLSEEPYYIRCHHTFTTGNALSIPTKGSCNVCQTDKNYNFSCLDEVIETFLRNNCKPIVELGFMPDVFSKGSVPKPAYKYSDNDLWMYPPKDYRKWMRLVYATVKHYVDKFGSEEVSSWYWEVWNEPDNPGFFRGSIIDYCKLYDHAVAGAVQALDTIKIGGPALARSPKFLNKFLHHCAHGKNFVSKKSGARLDFISFHAKGTGWPLFGQPVEMPSLKIMMSQLETCQLVLEKYPQFKNTAILIDECDMAVATNYGKYDFPEYEFHNTEYYPIFVIRMAKNIMDYISEKEIPVQLFTTWAYYFEGKRFFEGNRALVTNENIKKPIFNAFVMLEMLGERWVKMEINPEFKNSQSPKHNLRIDGMATLQRDNSIALILWNFTEKPAENKNVNLQLEFRNIPFQAQKISLQRFQIDREHSNAYSVWQKAGTPQDPTPEEIQQIKAGENLQLIEEKPNIQLKNGMIKFDMSLPGQSVCLLKMCPVE